MFKEEPVSDPNAPIRGTFDAQSSKLQEIILLRRKVAKALKNREDKGTNSKLGYDAYVANLRIQRAGINLSEALSAHGLRPAPSLSSA